ncbi:MAG: RDD family protein [Thermoplasmata archaeon]
MGQTYSYPDNEGLPRKSAFDTASTLQRIGAYIIDIILLLILGMLIFVPLILFGIISKNIFIDADPKMTFLAFYRTSYILLLIINALIDLAYFTFLESKQGGGATIGKRVLDIKVVGEYGEEVGLGASFIRNIARWLWQIPCIGLIILIIDIFLIAESDQRIGDRLAFTYVIKEEPTRDYPDYGQQGYTEQQWSKDSHSQHTSRTGGNDEDNDTPEYR